MFAKIAHQLQLFSLLLILLATIKFQPFFAILNQTQTTFLITALVSFSFLLSLGRKNLAKSLLLGICLTGSILLTVNNIYLYPSLGVLVLCLFTFGLFHIKDQQHSLIQDSSVSWLNLSVAVIFLLISLLFSIKAKTNGIAIYHLALLYSSLSVVHLAFKNLDQHLKFGFYFVSFLGALGVSLFYTQNDLALQYLAYASVALALLHFLFNTYKVKSVNTTDSFFENLFSKPEPIVIGYFLGVAIVGTFFLQTPLAHAGPIEKHTLIDSFFTALSAVCVTGLIVLDTPVDFSQFGQFIIILLIQLGGLGITTLSAWILLMLSSGRLSLTHEETIKNMSGYFSKIDVKAFLKRIVLYFVILESIGALILFLSFLRYEPWLKALWLGVFTSISAFCNAGFALNSDSLISYQNNSFILFTVSLLIIAGGFAPLMALDLIKKFRRPKLSVQEKVVISSTLILLFSGFLFYILVEWSQSLKDLSLMAKISNSWLQSATTRTAGFNSVDLTETRSITQMFMILLMFIGGNPGSAAGGIKTVTIAILAITAFSALKDNDEVIAFGKKIPHRTIYRASLIVFFSFGVHFIIFFLLSMTQNIEPISLMFETFSALGTVGLSLGATAQLDEIGKIIIIISMLAGRVGPLTFILLLMKRNSKQKWKTPEEDVFIT